MTSHDAHDPGNVDESDRQASHELAPGLPPLSPGAIDDATFRLLADNVPILCWVANGDGYIVWYNRRWHDYCGTTPEQMEGWGWQSVHDPETLPAVMERWTASIATAAPFEMIFPLRGADGVLRPFLTRVQPVCDADGTVARWFGVNTEISDQVAAETALRVERDRSRAVLEGMDEAFVLLDADFRVVQLNTAALRFETRPAAEIIGGTHWEVWPGIQHGELGELYRQAAVDRTMVSLEHPFIDADGHPRWMEVRAYPSGDGLAIFYRDVTDRRSAVAAIAESEQRLRLVVDGATDYAIITTDPERRITSWSQGAAAIFGYEPAEAIGQSADIIFTPEDRASDRPAIEVRVARNDGTALDERWHIRKDGDRVFLNGSVHPLPLDARGREQGFIKIARDETEQRRAADAVAESETRFRNMADQAPVMMWVTDPTGTCTYLNRRWYEFTGQPDGGGEGFGWLDAVHPDDRPIAEQAFVSANADQRDYRVDFRVLRADGVYRWAIDAAAARFAADGEYLGYVGSVIDIEERRETEIALQATTARAEALAAEQAAILGQLGEGVIVTDRDGRITFVNDAASRIHGVSRLDIAPEEYSDTYHLLTLDGLPYPPDQLPLARAVRGETVLDARWRICRPDGTDVLAIGSARPVVDLGGLQIGAVLTLRDDTERAAAEAALRENEARLRALTDNLPSGMVYQIATSPDGTNRRFLFVSQSHEKLTGVPADAVLADSRVAYDLILPEYRSTLAAAESEAIREVKPFDVQVEIRRPDGGVRWTRIISAPRRQADDSLIWDGIQIDVTDQKAAEALLQASNDELERRVAARTQERDRLWRNTQDLQVVIDEHGVLLAVSPAVTQVLGWQPDEIVGRNLIDLVADDDVERTNNALRHTRRGTLPTFENRCRHKDGSFRWLSWVAALEGDVLYASGRHVTADKEREAELEMARDALRQSQKMEAVGQLTGGIAHDFNNMLAVVIGSLDLLGRRLDADDARARRYVDAATDGARRAALLTQRLLAFSRQQPLKPEAVDVNALVTGMSDLIRGSLGSDVRFESVLAAGGWRTHADPNQLENVILNLAVNARDAMPDGGRLTIETQNAHFDARYAAANLGVPAGQYVLIAVSDTGSGMPADVIAKAFDPFFTTKAVGKGTGLGLSQVYGFVKQTGGHVKIYSEPGEGTVVKVYLPRLLGSADEVPVENGPGELPTGDRQEVILVVEDEPAVRQFSIDALTELGYPVIEADCAATALRLLEAHPEIVLMFTDVVMPDTNGRKLADQALQRRPDLKVLFTTGYTRNAVVHNGVLDAGVHLIGKPFTIEELAAKVRDVLDTVS